MRHSTILTCDGISYITSSMAFSRMARSPLAPVFLFVASLAIAISAPSVNVKLKFTDGALIAIAREATKRKTGARGLRAILENAMLDVMYEMPSQVNIVECLINEDVIFGKGNPIMVVYEKKAESA